jgi:hypothetical protein
VDEHADDDRGVDREQETPGIFLNLGDHAAPELTRSTSAVVPDKRAQRAQIRDP